jgi:thiol-disulfide isomerase/thioredoxin
MRFLSLLLCTVLTLPLVGRAQEEPPPAAQAPTQAQVVLAVGDTLPPVVIEELSQTGARSFGEFYGRAVLLEFFAYWCGPCAYSVPHLNRLQARYGARGLSVVAVTTEKGKKTLPWIEKNKVEYAWGRDTSGELHRLFQIQAIPSAALIDPSGVVVWTGDPRRLPEATIEGALADALAQPVWEWPEEARALVGLLAKAEFSTALQEAAKLTPREGFDAAALVRARITAMLARFEGLVEQAEYVKAFPFGERLEKGLTGLPEAETLGARLQALRADAEIARAVALETRMAELESRAAALRRPVEAKQLRADVATFLESKPGEKLHRRAKVLLEMLDQGLEKVGKKGQQQ